MSAEDELKGQVGGLLSGTGPRSSLMAAVPVGGPSTPEERIAALERDIRGLYEGLLLAGRQIEDLRSQVGGS
jgi:hypothetical protein